MMKQHKPSQIGGQKTNETGAIAAALALLHLQRTYPGTFIQFNPNQLTGASPHDIEQWEGRPEAQWAIHVTAGLPPPEWVESRYRPLRIWEVKGLKKTNKRYPINMASHHRLMHRKTQYGISYIFVLFNTLGYSGGQLHCDYRIKEVPGKRITRLVAQPHARKRHQLDRILPRHLRSENRKEWIAWTDIFKKVVVE
jgi:hypothetical protein